MPHISLVCLVASPFPRIVTRSLEIGGFSACPLAGSSQYQTVPLRGSLSI